MKFYKIEEENIEQPIMPSKALEEILNVMPNHNSVRVNIINIDYSPIAGQLGLKRITTYAKWQNLWEVQLPKKSYWSSTNFKNQAITIMGDHFIIFKK